MQALGRAIAVSDVCDLIDAAGPLSLRDMAGGLDVSLHQASTVVGWMLDHDCLRQDEWEQHRLSGACRASSTIRTPEQPSCRLLQLFGEQRANAQTPAAAPPRTVVDHDDSAIVCAVRRCSLPPWEYTRRREPCTRPARAMCPAEVELLRRRSVRSIENGAWVTRTVERSLWPNILSVVRIEDALIFVWLAVVQPLTIGNHTRAIDELRKQGMLAGIAYLVAAGTAVVCLASRSPDEPTLAWTTAASPHSYAPLPFVIVNRSSSSRRIRDRGRRGGASGRGVCAVALFGVGGVRPLRAPTDTPRNGTANVGIADGHCVVGSVQRHHV